MLLLSEWVKIECDLALTYQLQLSQERVFLPVQAVTCEVEGFLSTYKRISAPKSGSLQPGEAARQVGLALSLPLPDDPNAQEPLASSAEDWCTRGTSLRIQGRRAEALVAFEAALALDSRSIQALVGKGGALEDLDLPEQTSEALSTYSKAIEIDRTSAQAYACRGGLLGRLGRTDEALNDMNRGSNLNPSYFGAWHNKAIILKQANRLSEAQDALAQAERVDPTSPIPWVSRGTILRLQGRHAEALAAFEHALALEPELVMAATYKGNALYSLGRPAEALLAYEDALSIDSEYGPAWNGKGNALWRLGRYEQALETYAHAALVPSVSSKRPWLSDKVILAERPHLANALSGSGHALLGLNRPSEARDRFRQAVEQDANLSVAWIGLVKHIFGWVNLGKHWTLSRKHLLLEPCPGNTWSWIATAHADLGQQKEAIDALDMALMADQNSSRLWISKINLLDDWGRESEARMLEKQYMDVLWSLAQTRAASDEASPG